MSTIVGLALVLAAAVAQLALESVAGRSAGLPLLPVAVLAAWARTRGPLEAWAGLIPAALLLGAASEARAGWFVLALLPVPFLAALPPPGNSLRALGIAALAAAAGTIGYFALLAAAGSVEAPQAPSQLAGAALWRSAGWTALAALLLATLLLPFRPRERGLFQ